MTTTNNNFIQDNIDFILSHFEHQHELFPRMIMTSKTGGQVKIEYESDIQKSKDKIFGYFKQASFIDCKINAFPFNTLHSIDIEVKNKTTASFIMIDLDLKDFKGNREKLDKRLKKTLDNLSHNLHNQAYPTVLWTGNGYHVYQPIEGIVFEKEKAFYDFLPYVDGNDLTTEFLRFAEKFFTGGKADPHHRPSIKSCLIRIPGTLNSKNGHAVELIQKWNGKKPAIQWVIRDFREYLIQKRIDKIKEKRKKSISKRRIQYQERQSNKIKWIERLLQTPIEDYRKQCLWRILCPYLINIRKVTNQEAFTILNEWLNKCDELRHLDFKVTKTIEEDLENVKGYLPPAKDKLKNQYKEIYHMLKTKSVLVD